MEQADSLAIGVDVGATKIASALVTADGRMHASRQALTQAGQGTQAVLERVANHINELATDAPRKILGVGIGTPGQVNSRQGIVRNAVNLGWEEVNLVAEVRSRLKIDLPIWIQKDANASALGEYYLGAARNCQDFVYIGVGSGLGGGVVTNGVLVTGADWNAAELGHLSLDPQGILCGCGQRGCAETIVSGPGLVKLVQRQLAQNHPSSRLSSDQELSTALILAAAQDGDELALSALSIVGEHLGVVMAACISVLNPAVIVIGGGLGLAAFDFLEPAARREITRRTLPASHQNLQILPSRLSSSAMGAACLVWYFDDLRQTSVQ